MTTLVSRNPSSGKTLRELPGTPPEQLSVIFAQARAAQTLWSSYHPKKRARLILQVREAILNHLDDILDLLVAENGKPRFEALSTELTPAVHTITHYAKNAPTLFEDRELPSGLFGHRRGYLNYWPHGVVTVLSPWNFPFYLPLADIVGAVLGGNAVIFKPSELTAGIGLKIQELFEEAALPRHLVQTVVGDAQLGKAILDQRPDKIFFTGGAAGGKAIALKAAESFTPITLELGGKNAFVVLSDANLDVATSGAIWGAFANSGQICCATSRLYVHEKLADAFLAQLKSKLATLRAGDPQSLEVDLGALTSEKQKATYQAHIADALARGATLVCGGEWSSNRSQLSPTVLFHPDPVKSQDLLAFKEETFGPVLAVTTFRSTTEVIDLVNANPTGLTASIFSGNLKLSEQIAKKLQVGSVLINEVIFTAGAPEFPFGGIKESGIGYRHSELGLMEFVRVRHINRPRARFLSTKSAVWFPYTPFQYEFLVNFLGLYRTHWTDKLKAFPLFLLNLVRFLKFEKRL